MPPPTHAIATTPPVLSAGSRVAPVELRHWLQERWLARIRWWGVPLGLVLIPLFPTVSRPLTLLLVLGLGLANAGITWLLRQEPRPARLRLVRGLATALEWTVGLGVMGLREQDPTNDAPALLLVLVVVTGARYRVRGVVGAAIAAGVVVGGAVGLQLLVLRLLDTVTALRELIAWELLIGLMALVVGGLLQAGGEWFAWEEARWTRHTVLLRRQEAGLSRREWEVLLLLAQGLSNEQIGADLRIGVATVKTHVRHLGEKFEVTGRQAIVAAARQRGVLPLSDEQRANE